jgi:hypothetical protein
MGKGLARIIGFTSEAIHAAKSREKDSISATRSVSVSEIPRSIPDAEREQCDSIAADGVTGNDQRETHIPQDCAELDKDGQLPRENPEFQTAYLPPYSPGLNDSAEGEYLARDDSNGYLADIKYYQERRMDADEAAWQLDEQVDELGLPSYEQQEAQPGAEREARGCRIDSEEGLDKIDVGDSEDEQVKKRERMIRALKTMAGPPPVQPRRLPFPVIVPQRRPGAKKRGFVRAYAPVLADCGISQDCFLKFISDFHKASQVGGRPSF